MSLFSIPMLKERKAELCEFQRVAGIKFKNLDLLDLAFHHRSFSNESQQHVRLNNERLEFLGDAVLGMATASHLYESMEDKPEGDLAKTKAVVVSEPVLSEIALHLGIDKCLVLGKGEDQSGGRKKKAILVKTFEGGNIVGKGCGMYVTDLTKGDDKLIDAIEKVTRVEYYDRKQKQKTNRIQRALGIS